MVNIADSSSSLLAERMAAGGVLWCSGLFLSARWFVMSSLARKGVHLVVMPNAEAAEYCASDLYTLVDGDRVFYLPDSGRNIERSNYKSSLTVQRTSAIASLLSPDDGFLILVSYPEALAEGIPSGVSIKSSLINLKKGGSIGRERLRERLVENSFEKVDFVSAPGQFALRGSIVDIFSYSFNDPFRISFFGDEIEKISVFDCNTQLSREEKEEVDICPDLAAGEEGESLLTDLLPSDATLWLDMVITQVWNILRVTKKLK